MNLFFAALLPLALMAGPAEVAGTYTNDHVAWSVSADGRVTRFEERNTGASRLVAPAPLASIRHDGSEVACTAAASRGDMLSLDFAETGVTVHLKVLSLPRYFVVDVIDVHDPDGRVELLQFLTIQVKESEAGNTPFDCCVLALNLQTNVPAIPGTMGHLSAFAYPRLGFKGASAALVGAPRDELRSLLKEVVENAPAIPASAIGGPWALDAGINRESYLIALGAGVTEENVDDWIEVARKTHARQINFHAGQSLRFGDYEPNPKHYPNGMAGLRNVVARLHEADIKAGLHTYAQFIAKDTPWVTPKPDHRLAYDKVFTLSRDIAADASVIPVLESTEDRSLVTGFHVRNSVTLRIDDELIVFGGRETTPPYAFTGVTRGALGTTASDHAANAPVYHLKECFGLFVPDGDSTLYSEVAERTAHVYNTCGFDMIYLDAIDGSDIVGGWEYAWHYGAKFVFELARRLEKPALFEMSAFWHHFWYVRSRMGAWDASARGIKPFVDMHLITNRDTQRMFLPSNLGWLALFRWDPLQPERTFPDHMEYVLCKALAYDSSLSLLVGFDPESFQRYPHSQRKSALISRYERLRLSNETPARIREKLAVPGDEYTLEDDAPEGRRFTPVQYQPRSLSGEASSVLQWSVANTFDAQPLRLRLEALPGLAPYDAPDAITLAAFEGDEEFAGPNSNEGVHHSFARSKESAVHDLPGAVFTGHSSRDETDTAWTGVTRTFDTYQDLNNRGLGTWVRGDGSGALLNIQVRSPLHLGGGQANRYVDLDFEGWRYVELVELEGDRIVDYAWPDMVPRRTWEQPGVHFMQYAYPTLHTHVSFRNIETLSLFLNNIPKDGEATCHITPIKALPVENRTLRQPAVTLNGDTVVFPVELQSGHYLEFHSMNDCRVFDRDGTQIARIIPEGAQPTLAANENLLSFSSGEEHNKRVRARITVISKGASLPF